MYNMLIKSLIIVVPHEMKALCSFIIIIMPLQVKVVIIMT